MRGTVCQCRKRTIMTKELGARSFACPFLINMLIARRVLITEALSYV